MEEDLSEFLKIAFKYGKVKEASVLFDNNRGCRNYSIASYFLFFIIIVYYINKIIRFFERGFINNGKDY